ncbi:YjcZ family sporulation protein [Bacillus dakarensis]|uniref:YjcZ family sporulation protein n=1 Tax=Robertmurraya dakarensis TaxID=1926278 RepID=UPI0009825C57|nr:YjcZ family sporulation protein [Bacillus dakarensis]
MYSNLNAPPTLGANVAPNVAPMPTYTAPAYDYGCPSPVYSYGYECPTNRNDFFLIVVLFILLIIVGASFCCDSK